MDGNANQNVVSVIHPGDGQLTKRGQFTRPPNPVGPTQNYPRNTCFFFIVSGTGRNY